MGTIDNMVLRSAAGLKLQQKYMNIQLKDGTDKFILNRDDAAGFRLDTHIDSIQTCLRWANTWQMRYNADKCGVMHLGTPKSEPTHTYTMGCTQLTESTEEKDLGVLVHISLKVASQCAAAAKKGNRALGMIKYNFSFRSKEVILKLYKSLVRPHLDYAMQAWCPYLERPKEPRKRSSHSYQTHFKHPTSIL